MHRQPEVLSNELLISSAPVLLNSWFLFISFAVIHPTLGICKRWKNSLTQVTLNNFVSSFFTSEFGRNLFRGPRVSGREGEGGEVRLGAGHHLRRPQPHRGDGQDCQDHSSWQRLWFVSSHLSIMISFGDKVSLLPWWFLPSMLWCWFIQMLVWLVIGNIPLKDYEPVFTNICIDKF